jgi:hypothetical protein
MSILLMLMCTPARTSTAATVGACRLAASLTAVTFRSFPIAV